MPAHSKSDSSHHPQATRFHEVNFDGLVGPTHNYGGLAFGNVASMNHEAVVSHPREAALQGLEKMKRVRDLGLKQALLLPHERPHLATLRRLGFTGTDSQVLERAARIEPRLFTAISSSSAMWTANAATVAPSPDTSDGRVHFTPANLTSNFHRSIEADFTATVLKRIFSDGSRFCHHSPLPNAAAFSDEGAANHTRLCASGEAGYGGRGLHFFVYGKEALDSSVPLPVKFTARQTFEACRAIARHHLLADERTFFAQQAPEAIDAGVFHNDVTAVGNGPFFLHHEKAYVNTPQVIENLKRRFHDLCGGDLTVLTVPESEVSLQEAVASYLFNSQIVSLGDGRMAMIAPIEASEIPSVREFLERLVSERKSPISAVHYLDVRQSMRNGGGPACLRLRVVLSDEEIAASHPGVYLTDELHARLTEWVKTHYRDHLRPADLLDPQLLTEARTALDELTRIVGLGSIYEFQKEP